MDRKAKIVATIGPSCDDTKNLENMISAGMDVARLNFSHGTHEEHQKRIEKIRRISCSLNREIGILQDLQGPKMRVGLLPEEGILLEAGQIIRMGADPSLEKSKEKLLPLDVPGLAQSLSVGSRILIDDGRIELKTQSIEDEIIVAEVLIGGKVCSHKGVNLPGAKLLFPSFTKKDLSDLEFGLQHGIDLLAISFVRSAKDILNVSKILEKIHPVQPKLPVIAKLERPEAISNLDEILEVSDGVMVARGDLGVETSPSAVPIMQKSIIDHANQMGKIVITATQMLESMVASNRPTRAEASDVANAIFDGTDAVMLSGETASGKYPVESVAMMDGIVREAEKHFQEWGHHHQSAGLTIMDDATAITLATRELAQERKVAAIAVFTVSGKTALLMSKTRSDVPILAFTPREETLRRMQLLWGVKPFLVNFANTVEGMISIVERTILESTALTKGQQVIIISGLPVSKMRKPNFALLHTIGESY